MAFVETPRTGHGDTTELGMRIDDMSPEKTWHDPQKRAGNDLVNRMRNVRGGNGGRTNGLHTPGNPVRDPLAVRPNQQPPGSDEISLLLKSTAKPRTSGGRGKENSFNRGPVTPAVLKNGYRGAATPALETGDSLLIDNDTESYLDGGTPLPAMPSSSAHSTPVAELPGKSTNGIIADQRNQMTLREQENTIDRIEKENFGLKLKIHYFEELLKKADPNYNKTALKENVDLKVERTQLQRDVAKLRKQLKLSEVEMEKLRQQILELQRRGSASGKSSQETNIEITRLRHEYEEVQREADELKEELRRSQKHTPDLEKLQGQVEDLEDELHQKDLAINERDEKLEKMDDEVAKLQTELDEKDQQADQANEIDELKARISELEDDNRTLRNEVNSAQESCHDKCEQDREDLKEKIADLEAENQALEKAQNQDDLKDRIADLEADNRALQDELDQANESGHEQADAQIEKLKDKVGDLEEEVKTLQHDLELATDARADAQEQKEEAFSDLKQLREEMGDRSMHPKGLVDEVEHKARKLERDLREAVSRYESVQNELKQKSGETRDLQSRLDLSREEARSREHSLKVKVKSYEEQVQQLSNRHASSDERVGSIRRELESKVAERDVLQSRNDNMGAELQTIRNELARYKLELAEAKQDLSEERRLATGNENSLREEARKQISNLRESLSDLKRKLERAEAEMTAAQGKWQADRRALAALKDQAEARAEGLQHTVYKLQSSHDDASGKETRLKDVLSNEEQRHRKEQNLLKGQIEQLESEVRQKQVSADQSRQEQLKLKENVRVAKDEVSNAESKIQSLEDEVQVLSGMVEDEQRRSEETVKTARSEVDSVKKQLLNAKQEKLRVENKLKDVQDYTHRIPATPAAARDARQKLEQRVRDLESQLERLRHDKDALETKLKRSEEDHANARRRTKELEQDLRQTLTAKSQGSPTSLGSPTSKHELDGLRREVLEAQSEADAARSKRKSTERELRGQIHDSAKTIQIQLREIEQLRDESEARIHDLDFRLSEQSGRCEAAEKTVQRLRTRISGLEKDLHAARLTRANGDDTIASERKDLHELLKEARLEAEDLQVELSRAKAKLESTKTHERQQKDLVRRLQAERSSAVEQQQKLERSVNSLQERCEQKRDKLVTQKQLFDEQKQAMQSQMVKPAALEKEMAQRDHRHQQELAGLLKQIQWLRAKGKREEIFRAGLAFEKRFLLMNVEMYQSFNKLDLRLLEQMGITPDTQAPKKRPSFRAVIDVVIATVRMRNGMQDWRESRQLKESLLLKAAQTRNTALGKRKTAA